MKTIIAFFNCGFLWIAVAVSVVLNWLEMVGLDQVSTPLDK